MTHLTYTEDQLVEQPALHLLAELGWRVSNARDEVIGANGTLGRESKTDVVLRPMLIAALQRLNPHLPTQAIESAGEILQRHRGGMHPVAANRELYTLLKEGVPVPITDARTGSNKV